jgi:Sulfotransferase family
MECDSPLVIGGLGGSGTRPVARIIARTGRFMGANLNPPHDAMDMAEFDWRHGLDYLRTGDTEELRQDFETALAAHLDPMSEGATCWGWKHPHSYLLIGFLAKRFDRLRFVHVVRDGVDMAFSKNQNQLHHYGELALGPGDNDDPVRRIRFWAWANCLAADEGESLLGDRYHLLRFEDLCRDSAATVDRLLRFAQAPHDLPPPLDEVTVPASLGRARKEQRDYTDAFEAAAGDALRRFGYPPPASG